jgi:DNA-binding response OmpR family regulator
MLTVSDRALASACSAAAGVCLPAELRVLLIVGDEAGLASVVAALALDGAVRTHVAVAVGAAAGVARWRQEPLDAILIEHAPPRLDALHAGEALRAAGCETPLLAIGVEPARHWEPLGFEAGLDDYCCLRETAVRSLLWRVGRAVQLRELQRYRHRQRQAEQERLRSDHQETQRLLDQQRRLLGELELLEEACGSLDPTAGGPLAELAPLPATAGWEQRGANLPDALGRRYLEVLRSSIILGGSNVAGELTRLVETLMAERSTAAQALTLHCAALEELLRGLGSRGTRHVMARADLQALELLGRLADGYRELYHDRHGAATQRLLPGFEVAGDGVVYRGAGLPDDGRLERDPPSSETDDAARPPDLLPFDSSRRAA